MSRQGGKETASGSRLGELQDVGKALKNLSEILELARPVPGHPSLIKKAVLKRFSSWVDELDGIQGASVAKAMWPGHWLAVVNLHSVVVRELVELTRSSSPQVNRVEILLGCILFLFIKTNALKAGESQFDLGSKLALSLLRTGTFTLYATLLAAWTGLEGSALEPKLRLMAQFSLIFSSIAQLTVSDAPLHPSDRTGTALYEECLEALRSSMLLEHASKALLTALEYPLNHLPINQAANIRVGVMETSGCIVSALHGIAGKQGILDSCWAQLNDGDLQAPGEGGDAARLLLPRVREVLSGACLQFMLGREIVASRHRITGGQGPQYGLPFNFIPELVGLDPSAPVTRALTDRLLSRMGAASLVWHIILRERQQPGAVGPAGPWPEAQPGYHPVNIFDMVLEALLSVVDPVTPVEHLPGGSQLTLVEPAMLLVRLTVRVRPKNLVKRLDKLWRALATLLRRPAVRLQYSEHRPLQLIGGLLRLDLQLGEQLAAAAAAEAAAEAVAAGPGPGAAVVAALAAAPVAEMPPAVVEVATGEFAVRPAVSAGGCSFNLSCALVAGFVRAVEQLLRSWGRADPVTKGETSCLCTVNHLLRWPCVWPALLAHGSAREVASLTVTIRRLGEVFKDRGFAAMQRLGRNEPNEHQDAEVVVTAYMVALLEQLAVVLRNADSGQPLALNEALESAGQPVSVEALEQLGGRPAADTAAAEQQRALTVFTVSQWLPNAIWLARVVDTWFSVAMGRAALRWVLVAALQCLVARELSETEWAVAHASSPSSEPLDPDSSFQTNSSRPCGPGAVAYVAWVTFLMVGVDMLAWVHKYLAQLREWEGDQTAGMQVGHASASGAEGVEAGDEDSAGLDPEALLPLVLDVLEVLSVAIPRSVQMCVKRGPLAPSAHPPEREAVAVAGVISASGPRGHSAEVAPSAAAPAALPASATVRSNLDRDLVLDSWLQNLLLKHGRNKLLALLTAWAEDNSRSGNGNGQGHAEAPAATAAQGLAPGPEARQLAALRSEVVARHDLTNLPPLPSPYTAAEFVEAAGIKLCANPECSNLEGDSEADLTGSRTSKVCQRCKLAWYCSGSCQLQHWKSQHHTECQTQQPAASQVTATATPAQLAIPPPSQLKPAASLPKQPATLPAASQPATPAGRTPLPVAVPASVQQGSQLPSRLLQAAAAAAPPVDPSTALPTPSVQPAAQPAPAKPAVPPPTEPARPAVPQPAAAATSVRQPTSSEATVQTTALLPQPYEAVPGAPELECPARAQAAVVQNSEMQQVAQAQFVGWSTLKVKEPAPVELAELPSQQPVSSVLQPGPFAAPQSGGVSTSLHPAAAETETGMASASQPAITVCANPTCTKLALLGWSCVRCRSVSYCSGTCRMNHQLQHQAECQGAVGRQQSGAAALFGPVRGLSAPQAPQRGPSSPLRSAGPFTAPKAP